MTALRLRVDPGTLKTRTTDLLAKNMVLPETNFFALSADTRCIFKLDGAHPFLTEEPYLRVGVLCFTAYRYCEQSEDATSEYLGFLRDSRLCRRRDVTQVLQRPEYSATYQGCSSCIDNSLHYLCLIILGLCCSSLRSDLLARRARRASRFVRRSSGNSYLRQEGIKQVRTRQMVFSPSTEAMSIAG